MMKGYNYITFRFSVMSFCINIRAYCTGKV